MANLNCKTGKGFCCNEKVTDEIVKIVKNGESCLQSYSRKGFGFYGFGEKIQIIFLNIKY